MILVYISSCHYTSLGLDREGDFSIIYNMGLINEKTGKASYAAYIYGDQPVEHIDNRLADNDLRVLMIHDSFGDCVVPFLAMGVRTVDSMDVRHFTGSVRYFIEQTEPDVVIVLYNPAVGFEIKPSHTSEYDFR